MLSVHPFIFNPVQENTYLIANANQECLIVDPGCYFEDELVKLISFINLKQLQPVGGKRLCWNGLQPVPPNMGWSIREIIKENFDILRKVISLLLVVSIFRCWKRPGTHPAVYPFIVPHNNLSSVAMYCFRAALVARIFQVAICQL
jgi:hypothetical protein